MGERERLEEKSKGKDERRRRVEVMEEQYKLQSARIS